jgi:LysM domain
MNQIRRLTWALFFSGTLNIVLLSLMFYLVIREKPPIPYYELKPPVEKVAETPLALDPTNADTLRSFRKLSLEQLIAKLSQSQQVENGYTVRDLALASLVAFHQFDLARALLRADLPEQRRKILIGRHLDGSSAEIAIFPGLSDVHFHTIIRFANREEWPLTSKGLFVKLKNMLQKSGTKDNSLIETFYATSEFRAVERLFNRSEIPIQKEELLKVILEGNWNSLNTFLQQQRLQQDLSALKRQYFLMHYVEQGSSSAAYLLLKTDMEFAARKIPDRQVLAVLQLLTWKTPEATQFATIQLGSPRSDEVLKMAAQRLYGFEGEVLPEPFDRLKALSRFAPKLSEIPLSTSIPNPKVTTTKSQKIYIVQSGDSLWKISRQFKVDMQEIKKINHLESDSLRPGLSLQIPEK